MLQFRLTSLHVLGLFLRKKRPQFRVVKQKYFKVMSYFIEVLWIWRLFNFDLGEYLLFASLANEHGEVLLRVVVDARAVEPFIAVVTPHLPEVSIEVLLAIVGSKWTVFSTWHHFWFKFATSLFSQRLNLYLTNVTSFLVTFGRFKMSNVLRGSYEKKKFRMIRFTSIIYFVMKQDCQMCPNYLAKF